MLYYCENNIGEYQAGFRPGRGTVDQIFTLRQIMEKYREYGKESYHLFIDFKQAYDSIHRASMWHILQEFGVPHKLIRLVQMCYTNTRCRVRVAGNLTDSFSIEGGLKQGCCLSTLLFNLALEWIVRRTPIAREPIDIGDAKLDKLAFADDLDQMCESLYYLEDVFLIFSANAEVIGLHISEDKSKLLHQTRGIPMLGQMRFGNFTIEAVPKFKYLGSTVTCDDLIEEEVNLRIASASKCAWSLDGTFKSRQLSKTTKTLIYKTIIRPILTYGCETWRLTKVLEHRLGVFERSLLRRIWGPIQDADTGELRRLHNEELMARARIPPISGVVRAQRLRWAGHAARMGAHRVPLQVMVGQPRGRRPLGRPRKRWADNVREDLRLLGAPEEDWRRQAQHRLQWKQLIRAAKDLPGPAPPE